MNISPLALPQAVAVLIEQYRMYIDRLRKTPIIIAIDGHSSCGKSTLSKDLARTISYRYIDTGAMYRAVTWYLIQKGVDVRNTAAIEEHLNDIDIDFTIKDEQNTTLLNNENVEQIIRTPQVSEQVSEVAAVSSVRRFLVEQQQKMGNDKAIVMDGRDIGTVVFPSAEVKLFMTADIHVRAKRRYEELLQKGYTISTQEVIDNLAHRDHIDSTREDSPLRKATDAILLDTTSLNRIDQLERAIQIISEHL